MTDRPPCTASITNEHSGGTHHCVLEAGHQDPEWGGDHAGPEDEHGTRYRWSDKAIGALPHQTDIPAAAPAPETALRDLFAAAIASYDHAVGQATNPAPSDHHHGQADAVLAVRDAELERVRAERDRWRQRAEKRAARYEEIEAADQRVRAQLDDLCREPHPSHDHVCPDDVRRYILRALDQPPATA